MVGFHTGVETTAELVSAEDVGWFNRTVSPSRATTQVLLAIPAPETAAQGVNPVADETVIVYELAEKLAEVLLAVILAVP